MRTIAGGLSGLLTRTHAGNRRKSGAISGSGQRLRIERNQYLEWLGREDSNLRMPESKSGALPLGYAPIINDLGVSGLLLLPSLLPKHPKRAQPASTGRVLIADRNTLSSLAAASSCMVAVTWL